MKAEMIMQSNLLDIIFENRNKAYGAYPLRLNYGNRLFKSIAGTIGIALLFCVLLNWNNKQPKKMGPLYIIDSVTLYEPPVEVVKPPEEPAKPPTAAASSSENIAQVESVAPRFVYDTVIDQPVPTIEQLENAKIGTANIKGNKDDGTLTSVAIKNTGTGMGKTDIKTTEEEDDPYTKPVEIMPEFPGGKEALKRYLLHNISQPGDLEASEKVVVIATFVVNKLGKIENVTITKNGREDLDDDVVKVIKKMPSWKPGIQNGKNVSVYYSLPVTFVAGE